MKLRIASLAVLLASVSTAIVWLTLQPILLGLAELARRAIAAGIADERLLLRVKAALPVYLALDLVSVAALCFVALYFMVGRPVREAESAVEQLGRLDLDLPLSPSGGPLLSRLQRSLRRMAEALRDERSLTQRQVFELRQINDRLARVQTELIASERLATVGRLAAGVAHEVGNPLSGILGYLSLVRSRAAQNPELLDYVARIEREVQRIEGIVHSLLDLGRPPKGEAVVLPMATLVDSCVRLAGAGSEFKGVRFAVDIAPECVARAEAGSVSQVLLNLLLNAAQAMGSSGEIRIHGRRASDEVVVEVVDQGPGIPPEVMGRLFEPFFTTKAAGKGTGLGLAVSRHLVEGMGGTLEASNAPGGGAAFRIRLRAA